MQCRGYQLMTARDPVELAEAVQPLLALLVLRKRQRVHRSLADFVFKALGNEQLMGNDRPLEVDAWRGCLQAANLPAPNPEFGEGIVEFPLPLIAAPARG